VWGRRRRRRTRTRRRRNNKLEDEEWGELMGDGYGYDMIDGSDRHNRRTSSHPFP